MIRRLWAKLVSWGWEYTYEPTNSDERIVSVSIAEDDRPEMRRAIKFSILPARGGCVFETRTFNAKEHDWDTITHVIPDGSDVAHEVGHLVALELLKA